METGRLLAAFFSAIQKDGRICSAHIGLYATLLQVWQQRGFPNHIEVYSHELMPLARISSRSTYHNCIRDLHDFGYLQYEPSFNKKLRSKILLRQLDN
ncbi:hypothetical protein LX99_04267 [Mucilaginibacter oryzae]|uniref:Uncharacterized protein n=1 Tax=Mucilaginibacter oryzae TaxID=468058 RepID=A0A316H1D4_9SPHI|nr:hypothetical protein [Mucilaginibacter oryzae]PWK72937.1 hypothetical protein LX99_04267 [Mucilaginibacter oryzae]